MDVFHWNSRTIFPVVIAITFALSHSFGAPVSPGSFWSGLNQNNSNSCALLPSVDVEELQYVSTKVDFICNDYKRNKNEKVKELTQGATSLCLALEDLYPKLCSLSMKAKGIKVDTKIDTKEISSARIKTLCKNLNEITVNISQNNSSLSAELSSDKRLSRSFVVKPIDAINCASVCKNTPLPVPKGIVDDKEVSPLCVLLLKGYLIYQKVITNITSTSSYHSISFESTSVAILSEDKKSNINTGTEEAQTGNKINDQTTIPDKIKKDSTIGKTQSKSVGKLKHEQEQTSDIDKSITTKHITALTKNVSKIRGPEPQSFTTPNVRIEQPALSPQEVVSGQSDKVQNLKDSNVAQKATDRKTTTTTPTSVNNLVNMADDEVIPPSVDEQKIQKSSTSIPQDTGVLEVKIPTKNSETGKENGMVSKPKESSTREQLANAITNEPHQDLPSPKKPADNDVSNEGEDDNPDYSNIDLVKPSLKTGDDTGLDTPNGVEPPIGYDDDDSVKTSKTHHSNDNFNDAWRNRGTTINVSVNETEDTGFFSYFLFCVTVVGVLYLVIHNKKKLIAYVVEGKRPRSRSRSSSNSQYRRLENNFE